MDRLPWSRFHWLVIVGLGVSWILDGLEIQIVSQAGYQQTLHLSNGQVGAVGSVYLAGEVVGTRRTLAPRPGPLDRAHHLPRPNWRNLSIPLA